MLTPIISPRFLDTAYKFALLGAKGKELAELLGVTEARLEELRASEPELDYQIREGETLADAAVVAALHRRAVGFTYTDNHVSSFQGEVTVTPVEKYSPPDVGAAQYWLNNRRRQNWRTRTDQEISGPEGSPLQLIERRIVDPAKQESANPATTPPVKNAAE